MGIIFLCCMFKKLSATISVQVWRMNSTNSTEKLWSSTVTASLVFPRGCTCNGVGWIILLGVNRFWILMRESLSLHCFPQQPDQTPPSSRLPSITTHGHRFLPLACSRGLPFHLLAHLLVLSSSSSSTIIFLSLVIGLVSLSRRFHMVLRM